MQRPIPLTPISEVIVQSNKFKLLGPLLGASTPPSLTIPILPEEERYAPLYGDIIKTLSQYGARVNQVAVIVVAAALITTLVQQYGPGALVWIRKNMSKFCYMLAYRLQIKEAPKINGPIIDIKLN